MSTFIRQRQKLQYNTIQYNTATKGYNKAKNTKKAKQ